ncbi:MAG: radical SAM protein [Rhodospirillales bacterium]
MSLISRIRAWQRPAAPPVLPAAPAFDGYVDEVSRYHVAGWLTRHAADPTSGAPRFEAVLPTGEVLAEGVADQFKFGPSHQGRGLHGFFARLSRTLAEDELTAVRVHAPDGSQLVRVSHCTDEYRPVMLNAMDIVDNCNLRCPFCVWDYSSTFTTNTMDDATFEAAMRLMPFTRDSNFWLSCLHEPTLHPRFSDYLAMVPAALRKRVFFTSNFAKRMPPEYFMALANGGFGTVNVSIESLDPAIYERMRKGARHRIFMANWDALMAAFAVGQAPPFLRYIVMVYKSNLAEIPALVEHLLGARRADEIQLRFTFDMPHIPKEFRDAEYVDDAAWDWLAEAVGHHPPGRVQVIRPPPKEAPGGAGVVLPGRFECKMSWDGTLKVHRYWAVPFSTSGEPPVSVVNVKDIGDPAAFFGALSA